MEFRIVRTSLICTDKQPCEEAYWRDGWWFVQINTLEELLRLQAKHKRLLIKPDRCIKGRVAIEIVDD